MQQSNNSIVRNQHYCRLNIMVHKTRILIRRRKCHPLCFKCSKQRKDKEVLSTCPDHEMIWELKSWVDLEPLQSPRIRERSKNLILTESFVCVPFCLLANCVGWGGRKLWALRASSWLLISISATSGWLLLCNAIATTIPKPAMNHFQLYNRASITLAWFRVGINFQSIWKVQQGLFGCQTVSMLSWVG